MTDFLALARSAPEIGLVSGNPSTPGWEPAYLASTPEGWSRIVDAYQRRIDTRQRHAAASCALQSHAGRVASLAVRLWLDSLEPDGHGSVWHPTGRGFLLRYELGSARAIALHGPQRLDRGDATRLWAGLREYLAGLISLAITQTGVPCRTAWGNVSAGCAGPFRSVASRADVDRKAVVLASAEEFLTAPGWPYRHLVELEEYPSGRVGYRRRVCCLIHAGSDNHRCQGCCLHSAEQRQDRWNALP